MFSGSQYQWGHGLGSILSGLVKSALPIIKKGALSLGKTALRTGLRTVHDAMSGKNAKSAFLKNVKEAGNELLSNSMNYVLTPQRNKSNERKANTISQKQVVNKRRQKRTKRDIFS